LDDALNDVFAPKDKKATEENKDEDEDGEKKDEAAAVPDAPPVVENEMTLTE